MQRSNPLALVPALLLAALLAGTLLVGCEMFAGGNAGNDDGDELGPGLYTFPGIYSAGASEYLATKVAVSPFSLENALALTVDPGNYLVVIDQDETLPTVMQITSPGVCLVIRGSGGERRISRTGKGPLFNVRNSELVLERGVTLAGDPENTDALIRLGKNATLELYEGSRIFGNGAGAVEAGTEATSSARFTMHGGEIAECGGEGGGAAALVANNSIFTMKGGRLVGNYDGAVRNSGGQFVLECGEISGNHATTGAGGVTGPFAMRGGVITGNTSDETDTLFPKANISATPAMEGKGGTIENWTVITGLGIATAGNENNINRGGTLQFYGNVHGIGGQAREVRWSILAPSGPGSFPLNPQTFISESGLLTVAHGEMNGRLTVHSESAHAPEFSDEKTLIVNL